MTKRWMPPLLAFALWIVAPAAVAQGAGAEQNMDDAAAQTEEAAIRTVLEGYAAAIAP